MGYKGRIFSVAIVILFNIMRYFYYNQYLGYPFEGSFFVLTFVFTIISWMGGKQYDLARYYADIDPLTNVYNRRTIDKSFTRLAAVSKAQEQRIGVVLIDLDEFKRVNDTFGHLKGDELLRYVADLIKMNAKKEDLIVRWGGDEFVHVIPNIQGDFQAEYIEQLTEQLSNLNMDFLTSVSASIGIAVYPDDGERFETLVQHADVSMYKMKND